MPKLEVDEALVRKLALLLTDTGLTEIEYESGGQRIRVNRQTVVAPAAALPPAAPAGTSAAVPAEGPPAGAVTSPMVGTCYLSAEPGGAAFVKVGDRVSKGQTILIIEAMKVMNPIPAPAAGTVRDVMVTEGRPVEYGEILMVIN